MKRFKRNSGHSTNDPVNDGAGKASDPKCGSNRVKVMGFVVVGLMIVTVIFSVSVIYNDPPPRESLWYGAEARVLDVKQPLLNGSHDEFPDLIDIPKDKLLGGLLSAGFDEKSCLSRYQSAFFGGGLRHTPSPYLISRLRSYEALHKKCSPFTESYNKTVEQLKSGKHPGPTDCNYVVWISYSGLGNRILSTASAFLYALLTNRVLLIDRGKDADRLFCEPFPATSWLLPTDFPLTAQFGGFDQKSPQSYGNKLKKNSLEEKSPFVYLHLIHDYDTEDKLFFCEQDQSFLQSTPWLVMKTDNYFIPSLFLIPSFEQELGKLFPEKEAVFHLLGRYLFHPTNQVWGLVTRYYQAYLAGADERIGIQVRVFDLREPPLKHVLNQILSCILKENILPGINQNEHIISSPGKLQKKKAVLVTALQSAYYEKVRDMYWEYPTLTGEIVSVYQPSHEQHQNEKEMHHMKAWAEIYLLSLTDTLVTSAWSTFGYVAQGLGGLKPWIMYKPENDTTPDPPCGRAMSMEPCFHAPPCVDCKAKVWTDTGNQSPYVQHCEDMSWGVKLVDSQK